MASTRIMGETSSEGGFNLEEVQGIIANKDWYVIDRETGFDLIASIRRLTRKMGLEGNETVIHEAYLNGFTPDILSQVTLPGTNGNEERVSLVEAVHRLMVDSYLITEGNESLQREKVVRTGVRKYFDEEHYSCVPSDKSEELKRKLTDLQQKNGSQKTGVFVVDDKQKYTMAIKEYFENNFPSESDFTVKTFDLSLKDPEKNAQVFYESITSYQKQKPDHRIVVLFDFDGVVINTDAVLFGPVAETIAGLSVKK
jgi:hypothetical protein